MPNHVSADAFDVIVAGGGPAGATAASLLSRLGHSVLLVEREDIPRPHVGESLIPAANEVLDRLGMIGDMLASTFPKKHAVQFVSENGRESDPFYFDEIEPTGIGHTWQVVRSEFDRMLVDNAKQNGTTVLSRTKLRPLDDSDGSFARVGLRLAGGTHHIVTNRVFIDATGQSTFIASRLGLKQTDETLRNATVWTHFRGAHRGPGRDAGTTVILKTRDNKSWFWYIPLPDDIVSIGCTGRLEKMVNGASFAPATVFERELASCPALQRRLANAERVQPFRTTKDFSYKCRPGAGDGWVMIGDAYGFIDPVYSSGAFLALKSAEIAADAVHHALRCDDVSGERLGIWQSRFDRGVENFRRLVYAFYDDDFHFGRFLGRHPEHRNRITDVLVGNVFNPDAARMFADIEIGIPS